MTVTHAPAATPAAPAGTANADPGARASRWQAPWPAPALLTWLAAWAVLQLLAGGSVALAWCAALALGPAVALALRRAPRWRRLIVAAGFPVSAGLKSLAGLATAWAAGSGHGLPSWAWLLPAAALLAAYPQRAWRDAPMFPTPPRALQGLSAFTALPAGASLLDAGCGLGHGLAALRAEYPAARIAGVEWSWPLCLGAAARCRWARVRRGDMWRADWSGHALVYLFQRPESMARALAKAEAEMAPGSWLASLEFAVPGREPAATLCRAGAKPVWLYRIGAGAGADRLAAVAQPVRLPADNPLNKPAHPGRR